MRSRLKYSPALAAAAIALACGAPGASAATFGSSTGTQTYNAQSIALNNFTAAIPSGTLHYISSSGQGGLLAAAGNSFVVTWTTTGTGTAFTGALTGSGATGQVKLTGGIGFTCNGATAAAPVISGTTVAVTVTLPAAAVGGVGAGCTITLANTVVAGTAFLSAMGLNVTGLTNLAPASGAAIGSAAAQDAPAAVFGTNTQPNFAILTGNPFAAAGNTGVLGTLADVITVAVTSDPGTAANPPVANSIDANPQVASILSSANGFGVGAGGTGALVDLSGTGGSTPGLQFQKVANGVLSTSTTASLGTLTVSNLDGTLDAVSANACCGNTGNTPGGNKPLAYSVNVSFLGDFQTITQAFLRVGNNLPTGATTTVNGATPGVEQNPNPSSFSSACTTGTATGDIPSSPAPAAAGFTSLTFTIPSSTSSVNGVLGFNQTVYAVCVVTNNTNLIADTITNAPGTSGAGGIVASGVTTNASVTFPGIATGPIAAPGLTNAKIGFNITYAGNKVVFPNVFNASTGRPSSFRLVNTGLGTFPVYAILQKDGSPPITIPGSFAAMTPFSAFYVIADAIAFQGGQTLGLNNTITLLTPAPPGSLIMTHFLNDPNGDIVLVGPGL